MNALISTFKSILFSHKQRPENEIRTVNDCVQVITPGASAPFLNTVTSGVIAEHELDETIEKLLKPYEEKNLPVRWSLGPWSQPAEALEHKLVERGFKHKETTFGMYLANDEGLGDFVDSKFRLEAISADNLELWIETEMASWGIPPQGRQVTAMRGRQYINDAVVPSYLAFYDNQPVGVCGSRFYDSNTLYLQGSAVLPARRKQGFYTAMLKARIAIARQHNCQNVIVNALSTTSAPILAKLGFEKFCEVRHYFLERQAPAAHL